MSPLRIALIGLIVIGSFQLVRAEDKPAASQPATVEPVDFRKLKETLPAELAGMQRSNAEGEKLNLGEFTLSRAKGTYAKPEPQDGDPQVELEIMDYGAASIMAAAMTAWQNMEIDKETDGGFERTTKIKDQPAYMTYQNDGKNGQIQIFAGKRFYVNVQTTNLSADDLKKLGDSLPLEQLAELAKK